MKKFVLLVAFMASTAIQAQQGRENKQENKDISILVNQSESYGLSPAQREKLIARKKTIGREYAEIGRDRSLSGYEKGVKKRALSLQIQEDIRAILNEEQYGQWSSYQQKKDYYATRYTQQNEELEYEIDRLERAYEQDIKALEQQYRNDKYTLKREKNKRKSRYKEERQKLKDQRI
ncbi:MULTISPECIES: hypothetical protein [unclassified Myroides]|uniref:hypothetical protein n=1 Tax=unclassified Myroides TaxID=2642485 RepID=UPI003D2F8B74